MPNHTFSRRNLLKLGLATAVVGGDGLFSSVVTEDFVRGLPVPSYRELPYWRGFNLLEKFNGQNKRFVEDDFRWIRDFGFNFVRLPMDYRMWIIDNDWRRINERVLDEIDEAIRFGEKYGIHVLLNFHRAPGYTVAHPPEAKSVWTDSETLDVCILHWLTFTKRYKGIPNTNVSFNLFNEPGSVDAVLPQCVAAHKAIIRAIHEEDASRLIICDGKLWATQPFTELVGDNVAQAVRGYAPTEISHYKASWVSGSDKYPVPTWPLPVFGGNGLLVSESKREIAAENRGALVITGEFSGKTKLRVRVGTVSTASDFVITADGKTIFEHKFAPAAGEGEWKKSVYKPEWNVYQNEYDKDYETTIPAGTKTVELRVTNGDWLTLTQLTLQNETTRQSATAELETKWHNPPTKLKFHDTGNAVEILGGYRRDKEWLKRNLRAWLDVRERGCGIMVGEFGAHSETPHDVVLRWMGDMISNWKELKIGHALWNFRGSFGIMDSNRKDVAYEDFHGHKLDRKMLEVLQAGAKMR